MASSRPRQRQTDCEGLRGLSGANEREDWKVRIAAQPCWTIGRRRRHTQAQKSLMPANGCRDEERGHVAGVHKPHSSKAWRAERRTGCGRGGRDAVSISNIYH